MTNAKNTKKALLLSVLSLLVCFSMLLGTTFAWFTDSVTSSNNVIKSGNLDIELEYWNGTAWVDVEGKSDILTNTLWEPGVVEVAYLRVANAGSLALKYQLGINIVSETAGTNAAGEELLLSDYIQFGVVENVNGETGAYADREAAVNAVSVAKKISAGYTKPGTLYPVNNIPTDVEGAVSELYLALVVYMPTTVGNEANHKTGTDAPEIALGINVFATQVDVETDNFNNQYDKNAPFPTAISAPVVPGEDTGIVLGRVDSFISKVTTTVPSDAVKPDADDLTFSITPLDNPYSGITIEGAQNFHAYDVDIVGLKDDANNAVEMIFQLPQGLSDVKVYHYDDLITSSYDATTGILTFTATDFSPYTFVYSSMWDGSVDTSWYNDTDTEFVLTTAEQLAGLSKLCDEGNTFAGKTIKLGASIDLYGEDENGNRFLFDPIGDASNADFSGIFDGQNNTIYNLRQDCNSKHLALFGAVYEGTVKNLIIDGALIENDGTGYAGIVASYAGASNFENITLRNSTVVNYNHNTGGIVAWCSNNGTTTTFDGINIESTTTIGSWWGSYDTRVGGVVGAMNTGNYVVIKNSTIACRLDVYNDVTSNYQWYNYRTAGMIVADVRDNVTVDGRTQADPARVTCENVTVVFGDWTQYHYCESASYGTPSYADEGEYKFKRVEAGLGYGGIDINACNHAEDETHNELIEFTFLFGARDGKGIYGISEFEGVTVIKGSAN